jgi:hypothetical protein
MRKKILLFVAIGTLIFGSATSYASYPGPSEIGNYNITYRSLSSSEDGHGAAMENSVLELAKDAQLMKATEISLPNAEKEMQEMKAKGFNTKWYYSLKNPNQKVGYIYWKSGVEQMQGSDLSADEKNDLLQQFLKRDPNDIYAYNLKTQDGKSYGVSITNWVKYGILSYGNPLTISKENTSPGRPYKVGDQYRYHGYAPNGLLYPNDNFPRDADSGREGWEKSWLTLEQVEENDNAKRLIGGTATQPFKFDDVEETLHAFLEKSENAGWKNAGWTPKKIYDHFLVNSILVADGFIPGQFVGVHYNNGHYYQSFQIEPNPLEFFYLYGNVRQIEGESLIEAFLDGNNLSLTSVSFLDADNKPTVNPEAGKQYTARYEISYNGDDMNQNVEIRLGNGNIRNAKEGSKTYMTSPWVKTKTVKLKDGGTTYIDVGPFTASEASIYANGTLAPDSVWNVLDGDDYGEAEIKGLIAIDSEDPNPNLIMKINGITPVQKRIYSPQYSDTAKYEISYTINYVTSAKESLLTTVTMEYANNNNTDPAYYKETETVILEPGVNNRSFAVTPTFTLLNKNYNMSFSLEVNKERLYPHNETSFTDNKGSVTAKVASVPQTTVNPCVGMDKVYSGSSWSVTYNITTKTGARRKRGYHGNRFHITGYSDPERKEPIYRNCTCTRCVGGSKKEDKLTTTRSENFRLTHINFTSKDSGTVNLLNKNGKIKAGYGYELEIIARYTGSETPSRPSEWTSGCDYQNVAPEAYELGSIPNAIYVILPDGSIASNKAGYDFQMDCTSTSQGSLSKTLRCEVARANTYGNMETRKLYVHEDTTNGSYNMTVCTAQFDGANPRPNIPPLYDEKRVTFVVDGRYTDDITDHIIQ